LWERKKKKKGGGGKNLGVMCTFCFATIEFSWLTRKT
jgi:hypothetical protein